jgi:RNA-directed DNA polymerase
MKLTIEELYHAYTDARRGKSNKAEICERDKNLEDNMKHLYDDLTTDHYHIGRPIRFIIQDPVVREIIALSFRDRIVQHLVHRYLYPVFDP